MDDHVITGELDVEPLCVIGPRVEGAARDEVEARVVPVTCEQARLDGALVQREPEVRATVFDRERTPFVPHDNDWERAHLAEQAAFALQVDERAGVCRRGDRVGHASMLCPARQYVK